MLIVGDVPSEAANWSLSWQGKRHPISSHAEHTIHISSWQARSLPIQGSTNKLSVRSTAKRQKLMEEGLGPRHSQACSHA